MTPAEPAYGPGAPHALRVHMPHPLAKFDRIVADPNILSGIPCVRGTRISVRRVLDILSTNPSWDDLRADYPTLAHDDIQQVLAFAASQMTDRFIPRASKS